MQYLEGRDRECYHKGHNKADHTRLIKSGKLFTDVQIEGRDSTELYDSWCVTMTGVSGTQFPGGKDYDMITHPKPGQQTAEPFCKVRKGEVQGDFMEAISQLGYITIGIRMIK